MVEHIDGPLNWERLGKEGPPVAFVHPNSMDLSSWVYQMAHLSTWFRCVAMDLPGYGRSPTAQPGLTMPDVAQACWEAVDAMTSEPTILVGCSIGANVVMHMANQQPERTSAVVMSGAAYRPVKDFAATRIQQYSDQGIAFRRQHALECLSPEFAESEMGRYFVDLFAERDEWADVSTIIEQIRAVGRPDPEWLFRGVSCPTIIINGSLDASYPGSFELQKRIAGCEHVTMEGAGHCPYMERPWEWDTHFLDFVRRHGLL